MLMGFYFSSHQVLHSLLFRFAFRILVDIGSLSGFVSNLFLVFYASRFNQENGIDVGSMLGRILLLFSMIFPFAYRPCEILCLLRLVVALHVSTLQKKKGVIIFLIFFDTNFTLIWDEVWHRCWLQFGTHSWICCDRLFV